ncbi:MAG: DUF502 domain-containing protein [Halobacteriota archaeon]
MSNWKRDFVSGLVVIIPLIVTIWVLGWLFSFIAGAPIFGVIEEEILLDFVPAALAEYLRVVLTLIAFALLVFAVGYLMRTAAGQFAESTVDNLMNRLPGVRVVYNASKMAIETALGEQTTLQTPIKVEPWEGVRMTAFKTGNVTSDGLEVVFMPTSPNVTTGFVMEIPPEDIIETDEQVEQALTRLLSAGFGESNQASHFVIDTREQPDDDEPQT